MKTSILVVDDEQAFVESIARMLRLEGYEDIDCETDPMLAAKRIETKRYDAALLDITMPEMDGLELLAIIKEKSPATECIMITANESIPSVIQAVKQGAYDYLVKPLMPEQLAHSLDRALERKRLLEAVMLRAKRAAGRKLDKPEAFTDIITKTPAMLELLHEAELHAASNIPVLITGETGVGKELLARSIHDASRRKAKAFVAVNMLSLSPSLFESEFFGHTKGSFTGAERDKAGYLAKAEGGTLFLDEIGDLSMEIQGKLLRILQEGEFTPVGQTKPVRSDVRFVAATNQDLNALVEEGKFRRDLFYRLQFAFLPILPLRERLGDIDLLAPHFIERSARADASLSEDALETLKAHDWPGNVRELKGVLEAAANLAEKGVIEPSHLRIPSMAQSNDNVSFEPSAEQRTLGKLIPLAEVEKEHILAVYERMEKNKTQAAKTLEIGLQTLIRKLKSYGVK